ncbi:MAG: SDR family NAD(P)-dependent oxidoreductase, partial [Gemmatimonadetes bacterium]|nr:SDR family NAD(P)-dependent oxidoreductase [Gemmatimonadota bacterium]
MSAANHHDRNRVALITGASGGIGLDLVRLFARDCHDLVLVARSADRLDRIADEMEREYGIRAHPVPVDLSHPDAPGRVFTELVARGLEVDFLVNNAG